MINTTLTPFVQAPANACFQPPPVTTTVVGAGGLAPTAEAHPTFTTVVEDAPRKGIEWILRELGPTTLVAIHPDSGAIHAFWLDETCVDCATRWAAARNGAGFNIYFTANLPRKGLQKKPTKTDIETIRCIFADLDAKGGRTMDGCLEVLARLSKQPSLVIMSGGGYQPIWLLDQPVRATTEAVQRAESIARATAALLGGDSIQNVDRILRMPFTMNYPNKRKRDDGRAPCPSGVLVRAEPMTPRYSLAELEAAFPPVQPATVATAAGEPSNVVALFGGPPAIWNSYTGLPDLLAASQAGLPNTNWFDEIDSVRQLQLLSAIAADPGMVALADQPRDVWLKLLFSFADAEQRGVTGARNIALAWCNTSPRFQCEADFERDWRSFRPRPDGVTVATLLDAAEKAGFDLEPWREAAGGIGTVAPATTVVLSAPAMSATTVVNGVDPWDATVGWALPDQIEFLYGGWLARGFVTLLGAGGGTGKSALMMATAVCCALGRPLLDEDVLDPLRVPLRQS